MALKPSDILNKVLNPAGITPLNDNSTFPSHYSDFGFGGLRTVATTTERNAIPLPRQVLGMLAYVESDGNYWKLIKIAVTLTDDDWEVLETGGGAGLTVVSFNKDVAPVVDASWVKETDDTETVELTHNLNLRILNVKFYETGVNGSVFVPWEIVSDNAIKGCVPPNSAFEGFVQITSAVASGPSPPSNDYFEEFETGDWTTIVGNNFSTLDVTHGLTTSKPGTEIYDNDGNEQLLDVRVESNERIRLMVNNSDIFSGYVHIRG